MKKEMWHLLQKCEKKLSLSCQIDIMNHNRSLIKRRRQAGSYNAITKRNVRRKPDPPVNVQDTAPEVVDDIPEVSELIFRSG